MTKRINELPILEEVVEKTSMLVDDGGEAKRLPAGKFATAEQLKEVEDKIPTDTVTSEQLQAVADAIPTDYVTAQALQEVEDKIPTHDWESLEGKPFYEEETEYVNIGHDTESEFDIEQFYIGMHQMGWFEYAKLDYIGDTPLTIGETYIVTNEDDESVEFTYNGTTSEYWEPIDMLKNDVWLFVAETAGITLNPGVGTCTLGAAGIYALYGRNDNQGITYKRVSSIKKTELVKLPSKFIDSDIARVEDIPESFSGKWEDLEGRPFYEEEEREYILDSAKPIGGTRVASIHELPEFTFTDGETYTVEFDGVKYTDLVASRGVIINDCPFHFIGNAQVNPLLYYVSNDDGYNAHRPDVPFCVMWSAYDDFYGFRYILGTEDDSLEHTISVYQTESVVTKLPEKFLPDHEHAVSWEQIEDKPFKDEVTEIIFDATISDPFDSDTYNNFSGFNLKEPIEVEPGNNLYVVTVNGQVFELYGLSGYPAVILTNTGGAGLQERYSDNEFAIFARSETTKVAEGYFSKEYGETIELKIEHVTIPRVPLPSKFLPPEVVTEEELATALGDINAILDSINGEVI